MSMSTLCYSIYKGAPHICTVFMRHAARRICTLQLYMYCMIQLSYCMYCTRYYWLSPAVRQIATRILGVAVAVLEKYDTERLIVCYINISYLDTYNMLAIN